MTGDYTARFVEQWRAQRPGALVSPALWQQPTQTALRVHRRILLGLDRGPVPWSTLPVQAWTTTRWWTRTRFTEPGLPNPETQLLYARRAGIRPEVQAARLQALRRHHGVPPWEALLFGLALDGHFDDWPYFVYGLEIGWNLSASAEVLGSARRARTQTAVLADKHLTSQRLADSGLPVVATRLIDPTAALPDIISAALEEWTALFVKPRKGSAGRGAAMVTRSESGYEVLSYEGGQPGRPLSTEELAAHGPLLVQPLLKSPQWTSEPVHDIVTLRIVTRDDGTGPRIFSQVLELPSASGYNLRPIRDGAVGPELLPPPREPSPSMQAAEIVDLAADESLVAAAITAHQMFPGVFAIAWDIALTTEGPQFLEGNVGFGTLGPQLAAGGLLQGL